MSITPLIFSLRFWPAFLAATLWALNAQAQGVSHSKDVISAGPPSAAFTARVLVSDLAHPWSMAWLPNGQLLIAERQGQLRRVSADFKTSTIIRGLPATIFAEGQLWRLEPAR